MNVYHLTHRVYKEFKDLEFKPHPMAMLRMKQAVITFDNGYKVSVVQGLSMDDPEKYEVALIVADRIINESVCGRLIPEYVTVRMREFQDLPPLANSAGLG